ncbi:deoxyribonuclease V [Chitinophaga rhizophila]|uniref:Endonuclease V n=1 Tax=Chitinophaga rhizophila TaxID=2866212 RepID=A0ABS7GBJ2_9BACT|nr:deoxyribonuclease V [Chitinophaga rhizophila]MBW8685038.1 deoxyribonuclease V [Chitinophaga rhizophila]
MTSILTEQQAIGLQEVLREQVIQEDRLPAEIKLIAGVDVEYDKDSDLIAGAFVLLDYNTLDVVEVATHCMEVTFPYIPGLFSFREMPVLLEAWSKLTQRPDVIICDGQGRAHPRRFGLACHMGVVLDVPTLGCGKTRLLGEYVSPGMERGAVSPLLAEDDGEHIGNALRTQKGINPVFVSVGHKVSLETATSIVLKMCREFRLPETTRKADHYGREAFLAYKESGAGS